MEYKNFKAEMARNDVKRIDIAAFLNVAPETVTRWLNGGIGDFSISEAISVRDKFFPGYTIDYLFERES